MVKIRQNPIFGAKETKLLPVLKRSSGAIKLVLTSTAGRDFRAQKEPPSLREIAWQFPQFETIKSRGCAPSQPSKLIFALPDFLRPAVFLHL